MTGRCHRHSPRRIPTKDSGYVNDWALTNEDDFCGDFGPGIQGIRRADKPESVPIKEIFTPKQHRSSLEDSQHRQS